MEDHNIREVLLNSAIIAAIIFGLITYVQMRQKAIDLEGARRAEELEVLAKKCEEDPRACALEIQRLSLALAEEEEEGDFATGFIMGSIL